MATELNFENIENILSQNPGLKVRPRKSGRFNFPIYLTDQLSGTSVDELSLTVRSLNCLKRNGILTIGDFCEQIHSSKDLKALRNCGSGSAAEIMDHLFAYQYNALTPEKRGMFIQDTIRMSAA